jgi:MFS family permease
MGGLTAGAFAGWWLDDHAPNYGRVALIQSAALLGTVAGAISVSAVGSYPAAVEAPKDCSQQDCGPYNDYRNKVKQRLAWGMLAGLNVGLASGLAMAYLPDQTKYGPSWQRVIMVDLAGIAGAIFASAIELCSRTSADGTRLHCANEESTLDRRTARFALAGAGVGLLTGWLLTMDFDRRAPERPELPLSFLPLPGAVPVETPAGTAELLPGLISQGRF